MTNPVWDASRVFDWTINQDKIEYVAKMVESNSVVDSLDLGLGSGHMIGLCTQKFCIAHGLDNSQDLIDKISRLYPNADLRRGDISEPWPEVWAYRSIKFITAIEILEHLPEEDVDKVLHQVENHLHVDGVFIATVPADENLKDRMCWCPECGAIFHRWGHQQTFTEEKIKVMWGKHFGSVKVKRVFFSTPHLNGIGRCIQFAKNLKAKFMRTTDATYVIKAKL